MSTPNKRSPENMHIPSELASCLGVRRTLTLKRIMRQSGLPVEVVLDLALEILDIARRKLAPAPINRQAGGRGTAQWRNVSAEQRSEALRRAAQARWAKHRPEAREEAGRNKK